jgi:hypothetical protein
VEADDSRIPIHERVELPETLIPADSRVEIDAKITAGGTNFPPCPPCHPSSLPRSADTRKLTRAAVVLGYFTTGHRMTDEELKAVKGRMWEE